MHEYYGLWVDGEYVDDFLSLEFAEQEAKTYPDGTSIVIAYCKDVKVGTIEHTAKIVED